MVILIRTKDINQCCQSSMRTASCWGKDCAADSIFSSSETCSGDTSTHSLSFPTPTIAWDEAKCFPKLYDAIPAPATMASWTKNECEETWEPTTTDAATTTSEACASMVKYHRNLMEFGYRALIFGGCKLKKVVACFFNKRVAGYLQGYGNNLIILTIKTAKYKKGS
ncbi:hypothetical protein MKW98_013805 [Papaver atlanticum]|uniref:Uncharacterized protein n=1 Tax=Papaver atlanticum TaxID=357466 RepID=A0AAD4TDD5_9MAGN|nr:hypothetical protein MKW98_013805 [Papaver atlanticum]